MMFLILNQIIEDEFIVRFKDSFSKETFVKKHRNIVKKEIYGLNAVVIKTKDINKIEKNSSILYIQNAVNYKITFIPNDSLFRKYQWNAYITYLDKAWDITKGSQT
ncbi:MAG: hypothetical protein ABIL76_08545, partial [candidate division WOR-3 bacterium]